MVLISTVILFVFLSIFIGISQTTGPIINMLLMMGMGYHPRQSIAVIYVFILGGGLASIWKNSERKSLKTGISFVKLDLVLLTAPTLCSGTLFGNIFKNFFSEIMITFLFFCLFIYLIYDIISVLKSNNSTPGQGIDINKLINQQHKNQDHEANQIQMKEIKQKDIDDILEKNNNEKESKTIGIVYQQRPGSRRKILKVVILCVSFYCFTVLTHLLRGNPRFQSIIGIDRCGIFGWLFLLLHVIVSVSVGIFIARKIRDQTKDLTPLQIQKYSIQVTPKNVWNFLYAGFIGGFFAGLMAVGVSTTLVPLWMKFGVDRGYAANSTSTLVVTCSSMVITLAYYSHTYEGISNSTMLFYLIFAFTSSALVKELFARIIRKFRLLSCGIFTLLVVFISTVLLLIPFQIHRLLTDYKKVVQLGYLC